MEELIQPDYLSNTPLRNNTPTLMTERMANQSPLLVPRFTLFWQPLRNLKNPS